MLPSGFDRLGPEHQSRADPYTIEFTIDGIWKRRYSDAHRSERSKIILLLEDSVSKTRKRIAFVGCGYTPMTRTPTKPETELAIEACLMAAADAGFDPADIDGINTPSAPLAATFDR